MNTAHSSDGVPPVTTQAANGGGAQRFHHNLHVEPSFLIGRDAELAHLQAEAVRALHGQGRTLALTGEAGIGKTYLVNVLFRRLWQATQPEGTTTTIPSFTLYSGNCQPHEHHTPYSALRTPIRQLLGLYDLTTLPTETVSRQCRDRVMQFAPHIARFTPLLGDLLGNPLPETPLIQWLTEEQRHDRLQQLLIALLMGAATQRPLVLHLDDLHWADAASLMFLRQFVQEIAHVPLLLVLTYRPDPTMTDDWTAYPHTTQTPLSGLSPEESKALLEKLLNGNLQEAVIPVIEQARGNPLFIQETLQRLLDIRALDRNAEGSWNLNATLDQAAIPQDIEELLISRLRQLEPPHHALTQVAAVIGKRFDYPLLAAVSDHPERLGQDIETLIAATIIVPKSPPPEQAASTTPAPPVYSFRHHLLRDAVYKGMPATRRQILHRRVAEAIETMHAGHLDAYLALLAYHYLQAEAWQPALHYHLAAGIQARHRFAQRDALALLNIAHDLLSHTEQTPPPVQQTLEICEQLGDLHLMLGAYDDAQSAYLEALRYVQQVQPHTTTDLAPAIVRLHHHIAEVQERRADFASAFTWLGHGMQRTTPTTQDELGRCFLLAAGIYQRQGQYDHALEWTQRALQLAEQHSSRNALAHVYYALGGTYGKLGRTREAITAIEQSLRLYQELGNSAGQADAHNNLANVLFIAAGSWQEAAEHYQAALKLKEAIGDMHGQAVVANNLGDLQRKMGQYDQAMHYFQIALEQFTSLGSDYGRAVLRMNMGAASLGLGEVTAAQQHLAQSQSLFDQLGSEEFLPELYRIYAEVAVAEHQHDAALRWADESLALARRLNARAEEGETRRVRGLLLYARGQSEAAQTEIHQACEIFAGLDNQSAVARCRADLAQMIDDPEEAAATQAEDHRLRDEDDDMQSAGRSR